MLQSFDSQDWQAFNGCENFASGAEPLIDYNVHFECTTHSVKDFTVVFDKGGIHLYDNNDIDPGDIYATGDPEVAFSILPYLLECQRTGSTPLMSKLFEAGLVAYKG